MNGSDIWHRVVVLEPEAPVYVSGTTEQQSCVSFSSETEICEFMWWKVENRKTVKCFYTWAYNSEWVDSNTLPGLSTSILAHTQRTTWVILIKIFKDYWLLKMHDFSCQASNVFLNFKEFYRPITNIKRKRGK